MRKRVHLIGQHWQPVAESCIFFQGSAAIVQHGDAVLMVFRFLVAKILSFFSSRIDDFDAHCV